MPQSKPLALTVMSFSGIDLLVSLYFFIFTDSLIIAVVCLFSAAILFFLSLAFMPGETVHGSTPHREGDWGPTHSDWDSTD